MIPDVYHKLLVVPPYSSVGYVTPQKFIKNDAVYSTFEVRGKPLVTGGTTSQTANYYGQGLAGRVYIPSKGGPLRVRFANSTGKPVRVRLRYERD